MKAMILAAGRGERMRPLTDCTPKPLLKVNNAPLIVHHLRALKKAGFKDIVINLAHLGEQIEAYLNDGSKFGVNIQYTHECVGGLETGGGIFNALPLLGDDPFLVISADIFTNFSFETLPQNIEGLAHLILVDNPNYHLEGDFCLSENKIKNTGETKFTFGNIGIYQPELFENCSPGFFKLAPLLRQAAEQALISGEIFQGEWNNIGTPEQLNILNPSKN